MARLSCLLVFFLYGATALQSHRRQFDSKDRAIPIIPTRPPNIDERAHHAIVFDYYDEIVHAGLLTDNHPAVIHAPIFLFARVDKTQQTCYPEGAINRRGDGPNPGQRVPWLIDPGADCRNAGPYKGGEFIMTVFTQSKTKIHAQIFLLGSHFLSGHLHRTAVMNGVSTMQYTMYTMAIYRRGIDMIGRG